MSTLANRAISLLISVLGGTLAGAIFKQFWKLARREDDAPEATDASRGWGEILLAAAIEGAIFGLVKATLDRSTAVSTHKLTGTWPGRTGPNQAG